MKPMFTILILTVICIIYSLYPWEWGIMDDPEYVLKIHSYVHNFGIFRGIILNFYNHMSIDISHAGVLRPSFWAYTSIVYLLPVGLAYAFRLLQFLAIFYFSLTAFSPYLRQKGYLYLFSLFCALFSIRSMQEGLALISLQEFSGIFFIAIGLWVWSKNELQKNSISILVGIIFLLGIGFKPPFLWLLICYSIYLIMYEKKKIVGLFFCASGIAFLFLSSYIAKHGNYSQQIYQFHVDNLVKTILSFLKHFFPIFIVLLSSIIYFGKSIFNLFSSKNFMKINEWNKSQWIGAVFFISGSLYLATLLPRGIGKGFGYYLGPTLYMIVIGIYFFLIPFRRPINESKYNNYSIRRWIGIVISAAIPIAITFYSTSVFLKRNQAITTIKEWAKSIPQKNILLATNSQEVAARLSEILYMNSNREWENKIISIAENDPIPKENTIQYYIVLADQLASNRKLEKNILLNTKYLKIYSSQ